MIEVPRGALTADELRNRPVLQLWHERPDADRAGHERMTRSLNYQEEIVINNPFAVVDQTGVGQLMEIAATKAAAPARTSSWASAASTVVNRAASSSATASA